MADRQPAVLLLLGNRDGLAADCRGYDGANGLGRVRGLLEEGGVLKRFGLAETMLGVPTLNLIVGGQPPLKN